MRVAIVKQVLDTFGPWSSIRWQDTSPKDLFRIWPGRPLHWEMTTLLQADWYVIPQQVHTDYTYDSVLKHRGNAEIVRKYTQGIVAPQEIPCESYDLVIANDPILRFPENADTVFAYFVAEHWDWRYRASLRRPQGNADLFLAHMLDAPAALRTLPQAIAFPYVRNPKLIRSLFKSASRDEAVWADWRTLSFLSGNADDEAATSAAAQRLETALGLPVVYRSFSMGLYHGEEPPRWRDAEEFFRKLGRQKFYVGLGRNSGAGQGLADAASLGCICFGEKNKPYHRLLCHPEGLCGDLQELPQRVKRVRKSADLQREMCEWQDDRLQRHFVIEPLALLGEAVERKRKLRTAEHRSLQVGPAAPATPKLRAFTRTTL